MLTIVANKWKKQKYNDRLKDKWSLSFFLILLIMVTICKTMSSPYINVLWISDIPFTYYRHYYQVLKEVLSSSNAQITSITAGEIYIMKGENIKFNNWLRGSGYDLIIVSWSRKAYEDAVKELIIAGINANIPVLLIPGGISDLGIPLGLGINETLFSDIIVNVRNHKVANETYVIGLQNYSIIGTFYPVGEKGMNWIPLAMIEEGAIVAIAEFNGTRAAAIAPYLYAEDIFDNKRLIKNIIYWLLYMPVPKESEPGKWPPLNISEYEAKLLAELRKLNATIARLIAERDKLNATLIAERDKLNATLIRLYSLEERIQQLKSQLESKNDEIDTLKEELNEAKHMCQLTGTIIAVSFVTGFIISHILTKRYIRKNEGE